MWSSGVISRQALTSHISHQTQLGPLHIFLGLSGAPVGLLPFCLIFINHLDSLYFHISFCWVSVYILVTLSFPDWLDMVIVTWWLIKEYWVLFLQYNVGEKKILWEKVSVTKYGRPDSNNCKVSSGNILKFKYMPEKKKEVFEVN